MNKSGKILILLVLLGLLLAWPIYVLYGKLEKPPHEKQLAEMVRLADDIYSLTKEGNVDDARNMMMELSQRFPRVAMPKGLRIESLHTVTNSVLAAKQVYSTLNTPIGYMLWQAERLRIAMDALYHPNDAIWREYYAQFADQMEELQLLSVQRNREKFREKWENQYRMYQMVKPGMSVSLSEEKMKQVDDLYGFILEQIRRENTEWSRIRTSLRELKLELQEAFVGKDLNTIGIFRVQRSQDQFIWMLTSIVVVTLGYVAWKKYMARKPFAF